MHKFFMGAWAKFVSVMHGSKVVMFMFGMNEGIWMHMVGGGILGLIIKRYLSRRNTVIAVFVIAIVWEFVEIYIETPNKGAILAIYGSMEHYLYDSLGDIIGATIIAVFSVL